MLRGGCKRSFGPREQRSPKSLLHHPNPISHRCKSSFGWCKRLFGDLCSLGPDPPLSTFGNFPFSVNFPGPWLPNPKNYPEGPARQIDVSRQKLSPHCLEAIPKGPKIEKNQSRLKISISIEIFNLGPSEFPTKIGVWWVARLKISISIENFNPGGRS